MAITIHFLNRNNFRDEGVRVYRSPTPFDVESLPPVHDTIASGATEYTDQDTVRGDVFYYLLETFNDRDSAFSELLQAKALPIDVGLGPQDLIAGDTRAGFFGEVSAGELITGNNLATLIGLTSGTAQHTNEPWLKFIHQGKILFIAKKPYRHTISWNQLHAQDLVYGETTVEVFGDIYKCRLLTGGDADPASEAGGEWNDLIYPIHVDDPQERAWAQYTDADLVIRASTGRYSWCQETSAISSTAHVARGSDGVLTFNINNSSSSNTLVGWRPVLELIQD